MKTDRKQLMAQAMGQRLEKTQLYRTRVQDWRRDAWAVEWGSRCAYCGVPLLIAGRENPEGAVACQLDHLIDLTQGGTDYTTNLVVCCSKCRDEKGSADWIAYGKAVNPKWMTAKREKALRTSIFQHLTRSMDMRRNMMRLEKVMQGRWMNPRFATFAWCGEEFGVFGFKKASHAPEIAVAIMKSIGKAEFFSNLPSGRFVAVVERENFLATAWELIDYHGYLKKVGPHGMVDATPQDDRDLARWGEVFVGMKALQQGAWPKPRKVNADFASWKREQVKVAKRIAYKENFAISQLPRTGGGL